MGSRNFFVKQSDPNEERENQNRNVDEIQEENIDDNNFLNAVLPDQYGEIRRGQGRPTMIRTGERGRPRKMYQTQNRTNLDTIPEEARISEVPLKQAMSCVDAEEWHDTMSNEVKSILKNNTWKLLERPPNRDIIGSRMILTNKHNADGTLQRRKARIVARGFA